MTDVRVRKPCIYCKLNSLKKNLFMVFIGFEIPHLMQTKKTEEIIKQGGELGGEKMQELINNSRPQYAFHATGYVCDRRFLEHTLGKTHPESPERLLAILEHLKVTGLERQLTVIEPEISADAYIPLIHPHHHIATIQHEMGDDFLARLAVSATLTAVDAVCTGRLKNAFCAVRPPGHHALNTGEEGFCFYNNVAIAARFAQKRHGLGRILIVDWDYHHGNGTEMAFYDDPSVAFFSTHSLYAYPGTGDSERTGREKGKGYTMNVPLPSGADDARFIRAYKEKLLPFAEMVQPELVLLSAGFDSREHDRLGDFLVTDNGFAALTRILKVIASRFANNRLVSVLEGGYTPSGLATAVEAHIRALAEEEISW